MTTLHFLAGWRVDQQGALHAGAPLRVVYAVDRAEQSFGSPSGVMPSSLTAELHFFPGGQRVTHRLDAGEAEIALPSDATSVAIWFWSLDRDGGTAWDSQYGADYHFPIEPGA